MANDGKPRALAVIVGEGLRAFREDKGLRQDDVAAAARELGLKWGRSSVAALEGGSRDLKLEEFFLLSPLIGRLGGWDKPLVRSNEKVALSDSQWVRSDILLNFFVSSLVVGNEVSNEDAELETVEDWDPPSGFEAAKSYARNFEIYGVIRIVVWGKCPDYSPGARIANETAATFAARLTRPDGKPVSAELANAISYGLWDKSPGAERDARTRSRGQYETKRALQSARGHVSRELIKELQQELDLKWPEIEKQLRELDEAMRSEKAFKAWRKRADRIVYGTAAGEIANRARSLIKRDKKGGEESE